MRPCKTSLQRGSRVFSLFLGAIVASTTYFIIKGLPDPARVITNAHQIGEVIPGGELAITMNLKMNKDCDGIVSWWILDEEDRVLASDVTPTKPSRAGDEKQLMVRRKVPETIKPGFYVYKSIILDTCGKSNRVYIAGNRIPFYVTSPYANSLEPIAAMN